MRQSTIRIAGLCLIGSAFAIATIVSSSAIYACTRPCNAESTSTDLVRVVNVAHLTDSEIAYIYLQANQFDVEEAELGIVRGTASGVRVTWRVAPSRRDRPAVLNSATKGK